MKTLKGVYEDAQPRPTNRSGRYLPLKRTLDMGALIATTAGRDMFFILAKEPDNDMHYSLTIRLPERSMMLTTPYLDVIKDLPIIWHRAKFVTYDVLDRIIDEANKELRRAHELYEAAKRGEASSLSFEFALPMEPAPASPYDVISRIPSSDPGFTAADIERWWDAIPNPPGVTTDLQELDPPGGVHGLDNPALANEQARKEL